MKIKSKIIYLSITMIAIASMLGLVSPNNTASAEEQTVLNGRVFYTTQEDGLYKIKSALMDGTRQKDVVSSAVDGFTYVAASPDGQNIAYSRRTNNSNNVDIYTSTINGENQNKITNTAAAGKISDNLRWSPDNTKIVYSSTEDQITREIYAFSADGSNKVRLTNNNVFSGNAIITKDNKVIFQSVGTWGIPNHTLWSVNLDGTGLVSVSGIGSFEDVAPSLDLVSGDVYFSSNRSGDFEIWKMESDGSSKTQVTNVSHPGYLIPQMYPDGKAAFINYGPGGLRRVNLSTGRIDPINNPISSIPEFNWQSIQPLTLRPSLKPNASIETNPMGQYNVSSNNTDAYDGLDLSSIQIISGDASVDHTTGIITTSSSKDSSSKDVTYKVCSLSNPNLCSTFTIKSNLTTDVIGVPNTGVK